MAKVYDVPPDIFIDRLSEILKNEDIPAPEWASFVKLVLMQTNLHKIQIGGM